MNTDILIQRNATLLEFIEKNESTIEKKERLERIREVYSRSLNNAEELKDYSDLSISEKEVISELEFGEKTLERIQKIVLSELTKIAIVHLYSQGYEDAELVNFELELTTPSIIYEQEKANLWSEKVSLVSDMKDLKMVSQEWMYKNIFNMSDDEWKKEQGMHSATYGTVLK